MRVQAGQAHLGYCTNIHPGETWPEVFELLQRYLPAVKARVSPEAPMGVGLRLSAAAARTLQEPDALRALQRYLLAEDLYVFTINGFPFGAFHGTAVKAAVYQPDWRDPARLAYSNGLADVLAELLDTRAQTLAASSPADDGHGSISTVPGGFRPDIRSSADVDEMVGNLLRHAAHLHRLHERTGKLISLALEPEPHCFLETTEDAVRFFTQALWSERSLARFASMTGQSRGDATRSLPMHLGLCIDTCHAAVEFEDADALFDTLAHHDIEAKKIQLSAGLHVDGVKQPQRERLAEFVDPVYLHQVVARRAGKLQRYLDLPDALDAWDEADAKSEWRVHFHVPIFESQLEAFESTQAFTRDTLRRQAEVAMTSHLEVETYTWDVLPEALRSQELEDSIASELLWAEDRLRTHA